MKYIYRVMKYRCLTYQEFDLLSTDFNDFLYTEGINSYEWKILSDHYSDYAFGLLKKYSDLTFEKVLKEVQYLEYRTDKKLLLFECRKHDYVTIGIKIPTNSSINLTDINSISKLSTTELNAFHSFKVSTEYKNSREEEIFKFIESGFYTVDKNAFKKLDMVRKQFLN